MGYTDALIAVARTAVRHTGSSRRGGRLAPPWPSPNTRCSPPLPDGDPGGRPARVVRTSPRPRHRRDRADAGRPGAEAGEILAVPRRRAPQQLVCPGYGRPSVASAQVKPECKTPCKGVRGNAGGRRILRLLGLPQLCRLWIGMRDSRATAGGVPPRGCPSGHACNALASSTGGGGVHLPRVRVKGSRACSLLCTAMLVGGSPSCAMTGRTGQ
jgi:hypothetical protein